MAAYPSRLSQSALVMGLMAVDSFLSSCSFPRRGRPGGPGEAGPSNPPRRRRAIHVEQEAPRQCAVAAPRRVT